MSHRNNASMTPDQFRQWRKRLGLKQKEAADQLGLKKRVIQYYEKGTRDGKKVEIPKTVRLACYALASGIDDYNGEVSTLVENGANASESKPAIDTGDTSALAVNEAQSDDDTQNAHATTQRAGE
jgi:predicted transcriptional regulator